MTKEHRQEYHQNRTRRIIISSILLIALVLLAVYSLCINSFHVTFKEAWTAVFNRIKGIEPTTYIDRMIDYVAIESNAPRAIAAILIGTILAVSGTVMQTVTHNPLAEPYTIGISSAALFGVTIAIILGASVLPGAEGDMAVIANAFIFAMIPAAAIILISSMKKLSPNMMILVGIGMMYIFSAFTTFLKFNASEESLEEIYRWSLGTLSGTTWSDLTPMFIAAVALLVGFTLLAGRINLLMAGDSTCHSLGHNPVHLRIICFVMVSLGVAVAVCFTGTIGFVGLVAPHIARLFVGNNNKTLIPSSALIGALMIIISDIIVRSVPGSLPVGVVTALIGSPLFLFFLFKQRRKSTF